MRFCRKIRETKEFLIVCVWPITHFLELKNLEPHQETYQGSHSSMKLSLKTENEQCT